MPFLESLGALAITGVAALIVDYLADDRGRAFARVVFGMVAIRAMGVTLRGLASWGGDLWGLLT